MIPDDFGVEEDPPPNRYDAMSKLDHPQPPRVENCGLGDHCWVCSGRMLVRRVNPGNS